ncbi:MAG TPA: hypothetical protein VKE42_03955, partial [Candidatus Cybelea sp.]|nr:hypothetical protein [Candidatus Cybelea sp.]
PEDREYEKARRQWTTTYRRFLAANRFRRRDEAFWRYHRTIAGYLGWSLDPVTLLSSVISDAVGSVSLRFRLLKAMKPLDDRQAL